ncbi:MAG TPA: ABC transporter permease [Terriglobales bacterium]|nr:ABC transporter permease [Terriglobales bacterium]
MAEGQKPSLVLDEIFRFAYDTFCSNKVRFLLTALGMVIGTASLILVVTIGLTGKQYFLRQIQGIGSNLVWAEYEGGSQHVNAEPPDPLTVNDMQAVQEQVPGITAATPVVNLNDRIPIGGGKEREVLILGVNPEYHYIRNINVVAGRFFDNEDEQARNKVAVLQEKLADRLYGSQDYAIGQVMKLSGLPFTVIGTFKEGVETFGQTEVTQDTILIPYTVSRYFTENGTTVKQIYFSVADMADVPRVTEQARKVIQSRHRPESVYGLSNLTQVLTLAAKTANALTLVLLLTAMVVLLVSGIGIMNIMLATVSARIREIGIRMAVGATRAEIRFQFLTEAIMISLGGGLLGIVIGLALPFSVRFVTSYRLPVSGWSAVIALGVSTFVGVLFGTVPATRAAQLDPVESLRHE